MVSALARGKREGEGSMRSSKDRILTTHAGSLSRPANLIALSKAIAIGEAKGDDPAYAQVLAASDPFRGRRATIRQQRSAALPRCRPASRRIQQAGRS